LGPTGEQVAFRAARSAPRTLLFARLAWPGYTATVDDQPVPVSAGAAGLLQVRLPAGVPAGTLRLEFRPPGLTAGLASAGLALLGAAVLGGVYRRRPARPPDLDETT
ncbi:MAG: YfhO family protein, partial [Actinomycetota bacterium]|nr:YfhO family protein [Actinomycetota bacterium]